MIPDTCAKVASALQARHFAAIVRALRAREYDARSVRGRRGIRSIRVAVPGTRVWAWWGISTAWWAAATTTMLGTWRGVLYLGSGQIVQVGELETTIPSTTTDVVAIAEEIASEIDEAEIEWLKAER